MSNLQIRTLSSIAFVALILGPLFIDLRLTFWLYALLGAFTLLEILKLATHSGTHPAKWLSLGLYVLLVTMAYLWVFAHAVPRLITLTFFSLMLAGVVAELFNTNDRPVDHVAATVFPPLYVAASFAGLAYFYVYRNDLPSTQVTIAVFALIWINDSGAYLIGRKFGRTKLFERLSPNKTWEGTIGGALSAMLAGMAMSEIEGMPGHFFMAGFALTCVVFGSLGDLFESRVKRAAGVKDSGIFLPGHGGFFDRFDAMMLAVPAAIIYFETILPKPIN